MIEQLIELKGKVAIITGGTGVLGGAIAHAYAKAGIKVGILGRRKEKAEERVKEITLEGGEALALPADVLDKASLESAYQKVLDKWGKIDILINAAGGNMPGATIMPDQSFLDLSLSDLKNVLDLNQIGTILPTQVFLKNMIERKQGSIINISSMASTRPMTRVVGYAASKAAIDNFTKWMATEMAHKHGEGIRVNAIAPGFFITEQNHKLLLQDNDELTERGKLIIQNTPMGRFGKPEELTGIALFLASSAASFITGITVPIDGGFEAFSGV